MKTFKIKTLPRPALSRVGSVIETIGTIQIEGFGRITIRKVLRGFFVTTSSYHFDIELWF